jgi:hypothetical protein
MTKQDWTQLAGDPLCTETIDDWAQGMVAQLAKMSPRVARQTIHEMTAGEREVIDALIYKLHWAAS